MNKDKVYLKGYVVGHAADTLGYKGLQIQLENMDIVEIDKNLVHKGINKPQKPVIPQFAADYIEFKKENDFHIYGAMRVIEDHYDKRVPEWFYEKNIETFARAWLDGYTVEEKRYFVRLKGVVDNLRLLRHNLPTNTWTIGSEEQCSNVSRAHTRKELEEAGFGEVFNSPLFEVEEAEE